MESPQFLPYLARLRRRDSDSVLTETMAIQELLRSPGWKLVDELIEEAHGDAMNRILMVSAGTEGKVFEQAEYARLLGFLSGLRQFRWAAQAYIEFAERERQRETADV